MTNSKKFFVDFLDKKIYASKTTLHEAGKGCGDTYKELCAILKEHPDYELAVKEQKKHTNRAKETYGGCSIDFIKDYVAMIGNPKYVKEMENIIVFCKKNNENALPKLKSWLIDTFKDNYEGKRFSMATAKEEVRVWKMGKAKAGKPASPNAEDETLTDILAKEDALSEASGF